MGDRISFSFQRKFNGKIEKSVILFSHWDGWGLVNEVKRYFKELKKELMVKGLENDNVKSPLDRLEPNTIMFDFIRWFMEGKGRSWGNYYLGKDEYDGDNSDNGHFTFDVDEEVYK